jgi:hypothetical protein
MNLKDTDFSEDILNYLRKHNGTTVPMLKMVSDLTKRVRKQGQCRLIRGKLLSDLAVLTREKKVIRYRKPTMVKRKPRSSQGLIRISELYR